MLSERVDTKAHLWLQLDRVVKVVAEDRCVRTHIHRDPHVWGVVCVPFLTALHLIL